MSYSLCLVEGQADHNSRYPVGLRRSGLLAPILAPIGQRKDLRMDLASSDALRECLGKRFAQDIIATIHIAIHAPSTRRDKPSAFHPLAQVLGMMTDRFQIQERTFGGVRLFDQHGGDANQRRFVGEHLDEASMGNKHEVLVIPLAQVHILLAA